MISSAEFVIRSVAHILGSLLYRVKARGEDFVPLRGGVLLLPNHMTWVDTIILQMACPRPIRFVMYEDIYRLPSLHWLFKIMRCIPISSKRAKDGIKAAVDALRAGECICVFPEGELTRSGALMRLKRGYEVIARQAQCDVVPVWLDQLWGSIFSYSGGKYFLKWPRRIPYRASVSFAQPLAGSDADIARVRESFLGLSADAFLEREAMAEHAGAAALRGLLKEQGRPFLHDGLDGQTLDRGSVAAAALALSMELRHRFPGRRVGIVLPPGKAGVIANLAVILADKVPVNLNFTAGRMAVESSMQKAELPLVISAGSVIEKFPEFPWPTVVLRMEEVMPALKNWTAVWRLLVACVPWWLVRALAGVPRTGGDREAFLLFTSGSVGTPKGVPLTHRNVLANVYQFGELLEFDHRDAVLGSLPLFHSFGATVTLLYPMISGVRLATHPNPLDIATHAALIERFGVTLAVTTPTFLRGWLRKVKPEQIRTLKMVVTGAEKLPGELAALFEERMGKRVYQGYGLTETSPVVSFNQPNPPKYSETDSDQCSEKSGSCGKIVLGLAAQVRDPVTGERISMHDTGMLWVRGANVFGGYLKEPERTAEVLVNGWFRTGDLARFDDDGFLFIEGRLSRFSKIGGEMVPHETVESKITECFGWQDEGERVCCITGIPDEAKGEALVLLTTKEVTAADVRGRLSDAGFANLWIPRRIVRVDKVPVLGSGKLDIQQAQKLAHNAQE